MALATAEGRLAEGLPALLAPGAQHQGPCSVGSQLGPSSRDDRRGIFIFLSNI